MFLQTVFSLIKQKRVKQDPHKQTLFYHLILSFAYLFITTVTEHWRYSRRFRNVQPSTINAITIKISNSQSAHWLPSMVPATCDRPF